MCGGSIPFRYFLTELALAVTGLYLYLMFPPAEAGARFVLCAALFAASLIDYDWRIIPHEISMPGIVAGFLCAHVRDPRGRLEGLAGRNRAGRGRAVRARASCICWCASRRASGWATCSWSAMVGAFLGWRAVLFTLFVGSIFGSVGGIVVGACAAAPPRPSG